MEIGAGSMRDLHQGRQKYYPRVYRETQVVRMSF